MSEFKSSISVNNKSYDIYSLKKAAEKYGFDERKLPYSLKVLLENLLRNLDGNTVKESDITDLIARKNSEIAYRPYRVLMQDFTGVPAVVDLAAMRDAMVKLGGNAQQINPLSPVDLVIDHSVQVDQYASEGAEKENVRLEMERNFERYEFLKWGQGAFDNFRVVPPGTGICHQVNLEYLASVVAVKDGVAIPDTLVGTDSHTTMVNGLAVLGWGVGGIEAEAAMLGQPISMLIPDVVGFKLTGKLSEGVTATDLVLVVVEMLREKGVVGKFVEFYGEGLDDLPLADRATIANMAPEYGATCGFFPIDKEVLKYMLLSGRDEQQVALVEEYAKENGFWRTGVEAEYTDTLKLDMASVEPCISGPKRPQDRILLKNAASNFNKLMKDWGKETAKKTESELAPSKGRVDDGMMEHELAEDLQHHHLDNRKSGDVHHGDVVIAAITSCTNTSNPYVMIGAGLVARKARALGLNTKPWVKTSLAPGSQVVTEYLEKTNLLDDLEALGFHVVGYGCTTCIGNSGPLKPEYEKAIKDGDLTVTSVLSGNRNFEGRVHQLVKANYLASPPLVVAYAIAGSMRIDITKDSLGKDKNGNDVYLKDIWPSNHEIAEAVQSTVTREMFIEKYADVFSGDDEWKSIDAGQGETYNWNPKSTYIQHPTFFEGLTPDGVEIKNVKGARALALLGQSVTTDHISPAGAIAADSPAARYLTEHGVERKDWNSYGSRRGNHEVMMRGTFANIRIKNELADGKEGGWTKYIPTGEIMSMYDAAMKYKQDGTPLVVIAGDQYGTGSSRDWAAKGTNLLGVKAVITESFERIHRSNLVGMGVLPLCFKEGTTKASLKLDGTEIFDITGLEAGLSPKMELNLCITREDGSKQDVPLICRVDTNDEVGYMKAGGILQNVLLGLR